MINLMGSEVTEIAYQPGKALTVIMMCGLQGAGSMMAYALADDGNIYTFGEKGMTPTVLEVK